MGETRRGFLGTPIESAESALLSRKQSKASRAPRVWEQIVTDERGRRRLHGAFTGGFSAGYFNTVDTKEGFVPKSFRTSRSQRAEERTQAIQDFYDKDELEEMAQVDITTQEGYDTFALSQQTRVRERTEREAMARPIIPGEIIGEFVEGVSESIGVQLLQKMGWRQGKGIGEGFQRSAKSKWGPEASLSQQSNYVWNEKPKTNVQGLGFDPFRGSRAFERHKTGEGTSPKSSIKRSRGIAFGVGVLEETDTFGEIGDYVESAHDHINYYDMSDHSDDGGKHTRHIEKGPKRIGQKPTGKKGSLVAGFCLGSVLHEKKAFQLPIVPTDFTGRHEDMQPSNEGDPVKSMQSSVPAPKLPVDENLKRTIDSLAVFVAKGGMMSEEFVRQKHQGEDGFGFLFGGEGSEYYRWKLLDVKVTFQKLGVHCIGLREAPLTADDRGFLLGDERIQETPIASRTVSHPFIGGVPEEDRDRVRSALKSNFVKGSAEGTLHMEESTAGLRAPKPKSEQQPEADKSVDRAPQPGECTPVRSFVDWHPVPLLYKRFNVLDPLKGMPRESETTSKFMTYESALDEVQEEEPRASAETAGPTISVADDIDISLPPPEYTEPPLDIFKSIFDASEEDEDEEEEEEEEMSPEHNRRHMQEETDLIDLSEIKETTNDPSSTNRKRLNVSSEESEVEEEKPSKKKKSKKERKEETFDEEVLKGLSTSEFRKLLKTLKKGRAKKKAKKESKRRRRSKERRLGKSKR